MVVTIAVAAREWDGAPPCVESQHHRHQHAAKCRAPCRVLALEPVFFSVSLARWGLFVFFPPVGRGKVFHAVAVLMKY